MWGAGPPKEHMPKVWANDGDEAVLIHGQLMEQTEQQFDEECRANFQQYPPLFIQHEGHMGFYNICRPESLRKFRPDPAVLWNSDMMDAVEPEPASKKQKKQIDSSELASLPPPSTPPPPSQAETFTPPSHRPPLPRAS